MWHKNLICVLFLLALAACSTKQAPAPVRTTPVSTSTSSAPAIINTAPEYNEAAYHRLTTHTQCVPYARDVSGVQIRGNAHTWWNQAKEKGHRCSTSVPTVGSVMVLSKTSRLKYGHLAVVKRVIDNRNIEVEHTNWGGSRETRMIAYTRMPVVDSSKNNDWSSARFWNYPSKSYGSVYKVSGFIYPK